MTLDDLTPEQIEFFSMGIRAEAMCRDDAKGKRGVSGTIVCPRCGSELHYTVARNGHLWGKCSTGRCLTWME